MKIKKAIYSLICIILFFSLYFVKVIYFDKAYFTEEKLKVHFIDVGQGDSCFIEMPDRKTMLIDAGEAKYGKTVSQYIADLGYNKIDYVVATHPDSDHIGGLYKIFDDFEVKNCYASFIKDDSRIYKTFCKSVKDEGIKIETPYSGASIINEENFDIDVIGPDKEKSYSNKNDASIVLMISYFEYDFLFTGDASKKTLESYNIGDIEVLKASHHGSKTGISKKLAYALSPEYTVISVPEKSRYNHPHKETLELLKDSKIYKTSDCGTITAVCDKDSLDFETEK